MNILSRKMIIHELKDGGWEASDLHYGWTRTYKTLNHLLKALDRHDKESVKRGVSTVRTDEINTITEAGRIAALVLTGQGAK